MSGHPVRIAVVMDPIEDIKPQNDTTLAMLLAAQRRGWEVHYLFFRFDLARFPTLVEHDLQLFLRDNGDG